MKWTWIRTRQASNGRSLTSTRRRRSMSLMVGELGTGGDWHQGQGQSQGQSTMANSRIVINVGGMRHEVYRSTLTNIPNTRLAWLSDKSAAYSDYDPLRREYFFDRHPGVFQMILNYYRTGKLHAPTDVCGPLFESELAFWGLDERQIEPCCWNTYRTHREAERTLRELDDAESQPERKTSCSDPGDAESLTGMSDEQQQRTDVSAGQRGGGDSSSKSRWTRYREHVWMCLEHPASSTPAKVLAAVSLCFIVVSVLTFVITTHPACRVPINQSDPITDQWTARDIILRSEPHLILRLLNIVCVHYFTAELVARVICAPSRLALLRSALTWVDLLTVVSYYIDLIAYACLSHTSMVIRFLALLRICRVFHIFRLTRQWTGLKVYALALRSSLRELFLLTLMLLLSVLVFASLVYYAELITSGPDDVNDFRHIPLGFWWAIVTMTTLGYGDVVPRSGLGYVIGSLCAISGVLVIALPVPIIVNSFTLYYTHAQAMMRLPKKRRMRSLLDAPDVLKMQCQFPEDDDAQELDEQQQVTASTTLTDINDDDSTSSQPPQIPAPPQTPVTAFMRSPSLTAPSMHSCSTISMAPRQYGATATDHQQLSVGATSSVRWARSELQGRNISHSSAAGSGSAAERYRYRIPLMRVTSSDVALQTSMPSLNEETIKEEA